MKEIKSHHEGSANQNKDAKIAIKNMLHVFQKEKQTCSCMEGKGEYEKSQIELFSLVFEIVKKKSAPGWDSQNRQFTKCEATETIAIGIKAKRDAKN
jgi:hypothetical protein